MSKAGKITISIILALLFSFCIGLDIWWIIVDKTMSDKTISTTFKTGLQTINKDTDIEESRYFAEVQLNRNEDGQGLASYEIKYNYMLDENQEEFYSQGLQYTASSFNDLGWDFYRYGTREESHFKDGSWPGYYYHHNWFGYLKPNSSTEYYNYASGDNYLTSLISTNPVGDESKFKIQLGDELYKMSFKSPEKIANDQTFVAKVKGDYENYFFWTDFHYNYYYSFMDYNFFSAMLFNSLSTLPNGTNQAIVFEFGDWFNYEKHVGNGVYEAVAGIESDKVSHEVNNYFVIKVSVSASGLEKSSDSLFNTINGKSNYNTTDEYNTSDYFIGRSVIDCTIDDFVFIATEDINKYCLEFNSEFKNKYENYKDIIVLRIVIDLSEFESLSVEFDGFTEDCFVGYTILSCTSSDGQDIPMGVQDVVI